MSERLSQQGMGKIEAARGVYVPLDPSTDFDVLLYNLDDGTKDLGHDGGAPVANGTTIMSKSYAGKKSITHTFETDMLTSGVLNTPPKWWKFLRACGLVQDATGTNAFITWTGKPNCEKMTMEFPTWECGQDPTGDFEIMAGAVGTFEIACEGAGSVIRPSFTMTGKFGGVTKKTTTGDFVTPTGYDTGDSEVFLGATITMGGVVYNVFAWTLTFQGDIQSKDDQADVTNGVKTGIDYFKVANANPQLTMTLERVDDISNDVIGDTMNNVVYSDAVFTFSGGTQMTLTGVQPIDNQNGTMNEEITSDITCKVDTFEFIQV